MTEKEGECSKNLVREKSSIRIKISEVVNSNSTSTSLLSPPSSPSTLTIASNHLALKSIRSGPKQSIISPRKRAHSTFTQVETVENGTNTTTDDKLEKYASLEGFSFSLAPAPKPQRPPPIPPHKTPSNSHSHSHTENEVKRTVSPIVLKMPKTTMQRRKIDVEDEIINMLNDKLPWFSENWSEEGGRRKEEIAQAIVDLIAKHQPQKLEVIESKKILQNQIANFAYDKAAVILEVIKMIKSIKSYVDCVYQIINLEIDLSTLEEKVKLCYSTIRIVLKHFYIDQLELGGDRTFEFLEHAPSLGKLDDEFLSSLHSERYWIITFICNKYVTKMERNAIQIRSCLTSFVSIIWDSKRSSENTLRESDQLLLAASGFHLIELIISLIDDVSNFYQLSLIRNKAKETTFEEVIDNSILEENSENDEGDLAIGIVTVNSLIRALMAESSKTHFKKSFINTYQSFTSSWTLYHKLIQMYQSNPNSNYKVRVLVILKYWIESSFNDFDGHLVMQLKSFIANVLSNDNPESAQLLMSSVVEKTKPLNSEEIISLSPLSYFVDTDLSYAHFMDTIMTSEPIQIAQQLTLIDWEIFKELEISGLINTAWTSPTRKYKAINVISLIRRVNQLSYWVASNIVVLPTAAQREKLIKRFLRIADELKNMNSYHSLAGIVVGFNLAAIVRLKHTKALLRQKYTKMLVDLNCLFDPAGSYKNYRAHVARIVPPLIPYFGVCLSDVTLIDEGNLDHIKGYINFPKHELIYDSVREICNYRNTPYNFQKNEILYNYLLALPAFDEDQLFDISLLREPRA